MKARQLHFLVFFYFTQKRQGWATFDSTEMKTLQSVGTTSCSWVVVVFRATKAWCYFCSGHINSFKKVLTVWDLLPKLLMAYQESTGNWMGYISGLFMFGNGSFQVITRLQNCRFVWTKLALLWVGSIYGGTSGELRISWIFSTEHVFQNPKWKKKMMVD